MEPPTLLTRRVRDAFLEQLCVHTDCGPFDGGCLLVALALKELHGGEVHVIEGRWRGVQAMPLSRVRIPPLIAHHAVLRLPRADGQVDRSEGSGGSDGQGALYADADGVYPAGEMLHRFARVNAPPGDFTDLSIRPMRCGDLSDAPSCPEVVSVLAEILRCEGRRPGELVPAHCTDCIDSTDATESDEMNESAESAEFAEAMARRPRERCGH